MNFRICLFFLLVTVRFFGQDYTLKEVPVRDDLNTYLISSNPFIDRDGFVWYSVNTEGVFYKFDGRNKIEYSFLRKDRKIIAVTDPFISAWLQDSNGNIWAINGSGAYLINPETFEVKFIKFEPVDYTIIFAHIRLFQDKNKNVWVANGSEHLLCFDTKYRQKKYKVPQEHIKKGAPIQIARVLDNGKLLAFTEDKFFQVDSNGIQFFANLKEYSPKLDPGFLVVENGKLFRKNTSGTYEFEGKQYKYFFDKDLNVQLFNYPYNNFILFNSKIVTISRFNKVIIADVDKDRNTVTISDSLNFKLRMNDHGVLNEYDNVIWLSTYKEIFMLKPIGKTFTKHLQFKDKQVSTRSILTDSKDNLYVGSYSGLFKTNPKGEVSRIYSPENQYRYYNSMVLQKDSILWCVGDGNRLDKLDINTGKRSSFESNRSEGFQSIFIMNKSNDSLWVGTSQGLFVFDKKTEILQRYDPNDNDLKNLKVYDLIQTHNKSIWIATDKGLYVKKDKSFVNYNSIDPSFTYLNILDLHEDTNRDLWIATNNFGAIRLNIKTGKKTVFNQLSGLSNNTVSSILESKNAMWFATFYGLSVWNKNTKQFSNYYTEDGLSDNEFNIRSKLKKNDTTFYLGGLNGVVAFNPEKITTRKKNYKIFLSSYEYFSDAENKTTESYKKLPERKLILPYDRNFFTAEFAINNLFYYDKNTYYYKIEGLNENWNNIGSLGILKIYDLPAGDYVIVIKGKDFEGFETENEIRIPIYVEQVFFKSNLFIIAIICLFFTGVVYLFRRKVQKQKRIFKREKEIIELKSSALKAQMNPHFVFNILNNMQSILILKGEVEVNKYFVAFSRLLRLTLDMSKEELISLKVEIEYINSFLLLHSLQLNEELEFNINADRIADLEEITLPGMLIQPFVENAILHGLASKKGLKTINLKFYTENGYLIVQIEDNGIGREASALRNKNKKQAHKSWSTSIVNERVAIINTAQPNSILLDFEDLKENDLPSGTRITLKFKLGVSLK